jgi:tripartite-type tricarboxylate transporter receptor subunit TctC
VNKLLAMPEVKEAIAAQGAEPQAMSIKEFDAMYKADFSASKALVEASGAKIQ